MTLRPELCGFTLYNATYIGSPCELLLRCILIPTDHAQATSITAAAAKELYLIF